MSETTNPKYSSFTIVLPLFNEERSVARLIDYYQKLSRLIIIDNFSVDKTKEIALSKGVKVIQIQNYGSADTPEWFRSVIESIETDYIFLTSSTYFINRNIFSLANSIALKQKYSMIDFPIKSITDGLDNKFYDNLFTKQRRRVQLFFHKNKLDFEEIRIHEPYRLKSKADKCLILNDHIDNTVCQLRTSSTKSLIGKAYAYAQVEAEQSFKNGKKLNIKTLLVKQVKEISRIFNTPFRHLTYVWFRELWMRLFYHTAVYFMWKDFDLNKDEHSSFELNKELWSRLQSEDD